MAQNELEPTTELTTAETTELLCNRYGLLLLYYSNIEPGDEGQFIQGTGAAPSSLQPIDVYDPNYRDAAENKTGQTEPVNFTVQWLSTPFHCTWTGVECFSPKETTDGTAGYGIVKKLNLTMRGLVGSILEDVPKALNDLMALDLGYNKLTGMIPNSIGFIRYANQIFLGGNQLKGTIPSTIGHLLFLDDLYLQENRLTGSIPSEIGNMKQLCKC
jgi:Leucine-rich repeat (LRR) protein